MRIVLVALIVAALLAGGCSSFISRATTSTPAITAAQQGMIDQIRFYNYETDRVDPNCEYCPEVGARDYLSGLTDGIGPITPKGWAVEMRADNVTAEVTYTWLNEGIRQVATWVLNTNTGKFRSEGINAMYINNTIIKKQLTAKD